MFESSCHNIDLKLYQWSVEFAEEDDSSATNFEQQISTEFERQQKIDKVMCDKQKQLEQLEEELPLQFFQDQTNAGKAFEGIAHKAFKLRIELEEMVLHKFWLKHYFKNLMSKQFQLQIKSLTAYLHCTCHISCLTGADSNCCQSPIWHRTHCQRPG